MGLRQVAIAIDQLGNALIGGVADESISARAHRLGTLRDDKAWRVVETIIDAIFFWQPYHCAQSYLHELKRKGAPREYL